MNVGWLCYIGCFAVCFFILMDYIIDIKNILRDIRTNMDSNGKEYVQWTQPNHINCRCDVGMAEKDLVERLERRLEEDTSDYITFFRHYFPKAHQIYENKAGHICIQFRKDAFEYDSRVESLFLEEFGKHIKLLSISLFDSSHILVTLHIMPNNAYIDGIMMDRGIPFARWRGN